MSEVGISTTDVGNEVRNGVALTENHVQLEWTPQRGAARVLARCDELARCSDDAEGLTRLFLSPALAQAHTLVSGWMQEAGLTPQVDAMGNLIGHYPSHSQAPNHETAAPCWLLGSHLDTVPNAGHYDGMLGVLLAIEVVASLHSRRLPFAVEVIGFGDEEGVRFQTPFLGSRAVAGSFDAALLELHDADDITLRQALRDFGLVPEAWPQASYQARRVLGYLEAHIEQGPVLESLSEPLGIATAIAGQSRLRASFRGQAGHAGTLPMNHRRDALAAASEWILAIEQAGRATEGLVATVGFMNVEPNASNVVPGQVLCSLDVRHADDATRENAVADLLDVAQQIARRRGIKFEVIARTTQVAVPMDANLLAHLQGATGADAPLLVSGAGHDAAVMAALAPCAMLFLRTPGGHSHCPDEAVTAADVAVALQAMRDFLLRQGEPYPAQEGELHAAETSPAATNSASGV